MKKIQRILFVSNPRSMFKIQNYLQQDMESILNEIDLDKWWRSQPARLNTTGSNLLYPWAKEIDWLVR